MQLAQALGESVFERRLREKLARENDGAHWELSRLQQQLQVRGPRALGGPPASGL
jgi:myosin-18